MMFYRIEARFTILDLWMRPKHVHAGPYTMTREVVNAFEEFYCFHSGNESKSDDDYFNMKFFQRTDTHPSPDDKQLRAFMSSTCVCGFNSLSKLRQWFNYHELMLLDVAHYYIAVYEFDETESELYSNEHQDVIDLNDCELVNFISIPDLLNA